MAVSEIYTVTLHDALPICHIERHDSGGLVRIEDDVRADLVRAMDDRGDVLDLRRLEENVRDRNEQGAFETAEIQDRKSTRLNSSHLGISYAVFCLKKKTLK